jgi:hypothetical protein
VEGGRGIKIGENMEEENDREKKWRKHKGQ